MTSSDSTAAPIPGSLAPGSRVLLGVSGGIAAYKAAELVRRLREREIEVRVVLTAAAEHFVAAATFQALSGQPVRSELWDPAAEAAMSHIELARWADLVLLVPATADLLARLATGSANDLLSTLCLATAAPIVAVPAMNQQMWSHPATQANVATLRTRGVRILGPAEGAQACGEIGPGRMLEVAEILHALTRPASLTGHRVVLTAGPTLEDLDPVRFLGNRSSGRMGFALAAEAARRGAEVVLIAGPVQLPTPAAVTRIDVRSACEMLDRALRHAAGASVVIGAAAVADFRPAQFHHDKIKRGDAGLLLQLIPNPDVIAEIARSTPRPRLVVGFAAETGDLASEARRKLERKGLDLVCANAVGPELGFDREDNELLLVSAAGEHLLPRASKQRLAEQVWDELERRLQAST